MLGLIKCSGRIEVEYSAPFYRVGVGVSIYMKYSSNPHTSWAFTFTAAERQALAIENQDRRVVVCLICGGDGCAKLEMRDVETLCAPSAGSHRISCTRRHGEHYEVSGSSGRLDRKIAPSEWNRSLEALSTHATH